MKNRPFTYVCMACWEKAIKDKQAYGGVVNLNVRPILPTIYDLEHTCLTCGALWTDRLDASKIEYNQPQTKKEFFDRIKKRETKRVD